jgi:hypothetical protein
MRSWASAVAVSPATTSPASGMVSARRHEARILSPYCMNRRTRIAIGRHCTGGSRLMGGPQARIASRARLADGSAVREYGFLLPVTCIFHKHLGRFRKKVIQAGGKPGSFVPTVNQRATTFPTGSQQGRAEALWFVPFFPGEPRGRKPGQTELRVGFGRPSLFSADCVAGKGPFIPGDRRMPREPHCPRSCTRHRRGSPNGWCMYIASGLLAMASEPRALLGQPHRAVIAH